MCPIYERRKGTVSRVCCHGYRELFLRELEWTRAVTHLTSGWFYLMNARDRYIMSSNACMTNNSCLRTVIALTHARAAVLTDVGVAVRVLWMRHPARARVWRLVHQTDEREQQERERKTRLHSEANADYTLLSARSGREAYIVRRCARHCRRGPITARAG